MSEIVNPKVTVIVTVSNNAEFLDECLRSIVTQTYENIEIICVSGCQSSKAEKIIDEYKRKDSRVISFKSDNATAAKLKNIGIDRASGMFLMYVLPADYLEVNAVEALLRTAASISADVTLSSIWVHDEISKNRVVKENPYYTLSWVSNGLLEKGFSLAEVGRNILALPRMAYAKLYNTRFLKNSGVRFPENLFYEDNIFFFNLIFSTSNIAVERRQVYNHRVNFNAPELPGLENHYSDILEVLSEIERILKLLPFYDEIRNDFFVYRINQTLKAFLSTPNKYKKSFYTKIQKELLNIDMVYSNEAALAKSKYYKLFCIIRNDSWFKYRLKQKFCAADALS